VTMTTFVGLAASAAPAATSKTEERRSRAAGPTSQSHGSP
jgi:hypothetical protein